MPFSRAQALNALRTWNPAPVFLDAYATKHLPENLDIYFGPPEEFFLAPDTQARYTKNRLIPLLDDGNFGLVIFHDPDRRILIELDVEAPDEVRHSYQNWQQYLAGLMLRIGESIDDDHRVSRMADLVGFKHAADLLELWRLIADLPHAEYERSCAAFVAGLPA